MEARLKLIYVKKCSKSDEDFLIDAMAHFEEQSVLKFFDVGIDKAASSKITFNEVADQFFLIKDQTPPINKAIVLRLVDEWRGPNNEVEIIDAIYDGKHFFTLLGRKKIRKNFITGWRY